MLYPYHVYEYSCFLHAEFNFNLSYILTEEISSSNSISLSLLSCSILFETLFSWTELKNCVSAPTVIILQVLVSKYLGSNTIGILYYTQELALSYNVWAVAFYLIY